MARDGSKLSDLKDDAQRIPPGRGGVVKPSRLPALLIFRNYL